MKIRKTMLCLGFLVLMIFALGVIAGKTSDPDPGVSLPGAIFDASVEQTGRPLNDMSAVMPKNLEIIESEAFEGTALAKVILPDKLSIIGNRAFANAPFLIEVYIPESTVQIGENAFDEDPSYLNLKAFHGSYAQKWAYGKKIGFILLEGITRRKETVVAAFKAEERNKKIFVSSGIRNVSSNEKQERSTGRSADDLKASVYTGKDSVYVRSRYFP